MVAKAGEAVQPIGSGRVDVADKDAIRQQGSDTYTHTHIQIESRRRYGLSFILSPYAFLHIICFCNSKRLSATTLATPADSTWGSLRTT